MILTEQQNGNWQDTDRVIGDSQLIHTWQKCSDLDTGFSISAPVGALLVEYRTGEGLDVEAINGQPCGAGKRGLRTK